MFNRRRTGLGRHQNGRAIRAENHCWRCTPRRERRTSPRKPRKVVVSSLGCGSIERAAQHYLPGRHDCIRVQTCRLSHKALQAKAIGPTFSSAVRTRQGKPRSKLPNGDLKSGMSTANVVTCNADSVTPRNPPSQGQNLRGGRVGRQWQIGGSSVNRIFSSEAGGSGKQGTNAEILPYRICDNNAHLTWKYGH